MPRKPRLVDIDSIRDFVARFTGLVSDRNTLYHLVVTAVIVDLDLLSEVIDEMGIA